MGYTTIFEGEVTVSPPLNHAERAYLTKFAQTRRMQRDRGPYFVEGSGFLGQGHDNDIVNHNEPPPEQPGLWCHWVPTESGDGIQWDGGEKFYDAEEWMRYLVDTFLRPGATLQHELKNPVPGRVYAEEFESFTFDHSVEGDIDASGEEPGDTWTLSVVNNEISTT